MLMEKEGGLVAEKEEDSAAGSVVVTEEEAMAEATVAVMAEDSAAETEAGSAVETDDEGIKAEPPRAALAKVAMTTRGS